jgi:N-methylhydantoinase A/oxoprolinase/acetone carboxylase beta subunit
MRNKKGNLVITRVNGERSIIAGEIEISDEDIREYLEQNPDRITDATIREISEIVFEILNENFAGALREAFELVMNERKINARYE